MKRRKISPENRVVLASVKNVDKKQTNFCKKMGTLNQEVTIAIHDMCKAMGGEVVVDTTLDSSPLITYDGGNHVEYNSTICGVVCAIRATEKNGYKTFQVDLEEEDEYDCDRIGFNDVCQIFDFVYGKFKDWLDDPDKDNDIDIDEIGEQD